MSFQNCSLKLRVLALVVNTGNLINERSTQLLGMAHALVAPVAIFTVYSFIGVFVLGAFRKRNSSLFIEIYGLISCCIIEILLSYIVFEDLKHAAVAAKTAASALNGVLPMVNTVLLLVDLTMIILVDRDEILPSPSLPGNSTPT